MKEFEKNVKETYNKISNIYHQRRLEKKQSYNEFLEMPATLSLLKKIKNKRVLDLGCGTGIYANILKSYGANVYGIDTSLGMITIAKSYAPGIDFRVGSVYKMPYKSNYFDVIVSAFVFQHFENIDKALKEIRRVLKTNGIYVFSLSNPIMEVSHHIKNKKRRFREFGNYFKEEKFTQTWFGKKKYKTKVLHMHYTYQTIIRAIIRNEFAIEDYIDAKIIPEGKKFEEKDNFEFLSKVPQVCVFKIRKI